MKKITADIAFSCILVATFLVAPHAWSNDRIAKRILELIPQADANGDGVLSASEHASVRRAALRKYPQADLNGDGVLSEAEQEQLLDKATATRSASKKPLSTATPAAEPAQAESAIRQGPRPISAGKHGIGRRLADLTFTDIAGKRYDLNDFANKKALVFVMTGTGCPLCLKYAPSLSEIEKRYRSRGVAFVFVNPNESEPNEKIQDAVKKHGFQGPYVRDAKKTLTAVLGAETTTEVFVVDQARTLVYRGAVDDQYGFAYSLNSPRHNYLTDALDAVLSGAAPATQATTAPGCELLYDAVKPAKAATITYHNRVSRIIQANCIECHRGGGIAPIPLESYAQVKDYAGMIRNVINRGIMPPWFAAPQPKSAQDEAETLHWANDRSLSDAEKKDLFAWIKAGAPQGDPQNAPLPKTFPDGWLIGKPDAVFEFPRPIAIKASGIMPYKYVTVETNLEEDKWVQAIEVRPGKLDVVHHVIVSVRADEGRFDERDGYWGAYVPGNSTLVYPEGYARLLPKGARLRFQMHYTPNGTATEDSTRIGVIYADKPPQHEVKVAGISNSRISIPPGAANHRETASLRLPQDVQVLSFLPHMHLRGKAARYEVLTANESETLLDIPRYDFNWQLLYRLAEPRTLRKGDTIRFTCWFDNSKNNPANPNPNKTVRWGQQTEDEMHLGYVEYIVPGATPGESLANMRKARESGAPRGGDNHELRLAGREINVAELLSAIRRLDRNKDGKLTRAETPAKHRRLFDVLDANGDGALTVEEARETIRKRQSQ